MKLTPAIIALSLFLPLASARAQSDEEATVIFKDGTTVIPLDAVQIADGRITIVKDAGRFKAEAAQNFPVDVINRIGGAEPPAFRKAIAMILIGSATDAVKLLDPVAAQHKSTAAILGNFWVEAMRLSMIAQGVAGQAAKIEELSRDMNQTAKREALGDNAAELARLLSNPTKAKPEERASQLLTFVNELRPAELNGIAAFEAAELLFKAHKEAEALDTYLTVTSLYPTAGTSVVAACELRIADLLARDGKKEQAILTYKSAEKYGASTIIATQAAEKLKSLE